MRLGLSTYSYTWSVGVPGKMPEIRMTAYNLIDEAVRFGLKCIQIADNLPLHLLNSDELSKLSAYASLHGVDIEVGTRNLQIENTLQYIAIAASLKSPILRMVVDGLGFEPSLTEVINIIREILPLLKQHQIRLAIENHDRFKASEFVEMITQTDPRWVGICLDSVNSMGAGEGLHEVVSELAPYTINLHLKDFSVKRVWHKMGFVIEGLPAGDGMLNICWLKKEVEKFGNCQSAILELWTPPEQTLDKTIEKEKQWVDQSIKNLKSMF